MLQPLLQLTRKIICMHVISLLHAHLICLLQSRLSLHKQISEISIKMMWMTGEEEDKEKEEKDGGSTDFHVLLGRKSLANHDQLAKKV